MMTAQTAKSLAQLGANLEITADSHFTVQTIEELVRVVVQNDGQIVIHAGVYTAQALENIVRIGKNKVTIRI